ncbi:MAG: Cutinase [Aureobasidium pullulans]|nr:MAG: Cutinase [Aureobasidium pullulans]
MAFRRRDNQAGDNEGHHSDGSTATNNSTGDLETRMKDLEKAVVHRRPQARRRISDVAPEGTDREITLKERLRHFTWAWFTLTMSTGGFATLLSVQPHKFTGLLTIGTIVYIFDLVLFVILCAAITARFIMYPGSFHKSLKHPTEALFFPTFWLSLPTIIGGMNNYGVGNVGGWLIVTLRVLFWLYFACTLLVAIFQYWYLFASKTLLVKSMAPSWILPIFPVMLTGTLANIIASNQPPEQRLPIIVAGVASQGLGWTVAVMIYAVMIVRLFEYGLPPPNARPGMFICVGPAGFTILALIGMSNALPEGYGYFAKNPTAIPALQAMALFVSIFIWMIGFWWFALATISVLYGIKQMSFSLVNWALVFPNVGFTIAVINIGQQLESQCILWVGSIMSILVFAIWLFNLYAHARAVLTKRMMMPGQDEDKGEEDEE